MLLALYLGVFTLSGGNGIVGMVDGGVVQGKGVSRRIATQAHRSLDYFDYTKKLFNTDLAIINNIH